MIQIWADKIFCGKYLTLMTERTSSSPLRAFTVTSRPELRKVKAFPITLQHLFAEHQVNNINEIKKYKAFLSGEYLSVDSDGYLIISVCSSAMSIKNTTVIIIFLQTKEEDGAVFLRYNLESSNSSLLCAIGSDGNSSYLTSHSRSTKPIRLNNSTICQSVSNFKNAVTNDNDLKQALTERGYRFRLQAADASFLEVVSVSKELRSLCCIFDEKCKEIDKPF
jgi:hypothetical protein